MHPGPLTTLPTFCRPWELEYKGLYRSIPENPLY
nr:MAG TPA: RK-1-like defensin [Caudoviricetes sp.]